MHFFLVNKLPKCNNQSSIENKRRINMRGTKAKRLRKEAGYVIGGRQRYGRDRKTGTIYCMGARGIYHDIKKEAKRGGE